MFLTKQIILFLILFKLCLNTECFDGTKCPGTQKCCANKEGTGCCPYSSGVCCKDMNHCCPPNYTCTDNGSCAPNQ